MKQPIIPPRSRLYQLKPVGVGTPLVESLTSYIARLAEAHCLPPGALIEKELTPIVKKVSRNSKSEQQPSRAGIFNRTGTLNGIGVMSMDWVRTLETLTLCRELRFLTMLTWTEILPLRNLLCRPKWAYCPACYQEWRSSGQLMYEPLLWAINGVRICSLHQRPLCSRCLHCNLSLPPLAWNSRPGYCSKCDGWLGISSDVELPDSEALTEEEWQWQLWMIDSIGELIAAAPRLPSPPTRERIAKAFSACIGEVSEGNIAAFARLLQKPKNTVWMWYAGKALPPLDVLTRTCYCLGMSVLNFLNIKVVATSNSKIINLPQSQPPSKPRKSPKPLDLKRMRQALEAVIECDESPLLSMKEVAKRLDYDVERLRRHFPDLCRAISARYINYQRACYNKRIEQLCLEVRRIAFELDTQGLYPSSTRVSLYLKQPGCIRNKDARAALHEVRLTLGWKT